MQRLLILRLHVEACAATATLNGFPLLRARPGAATCNQAVNEFVLEGANRLGLHTQPWPGQPGRAPRLAANGARARVELLLTRPGRMLSDTSNRAVASLDWVAADGDLYPARASEQNFDLPVKFPRWRWLDAPEVVPAHVHDRVVEFLQDIALSMHRGEPEAFLQASRVRLEDLAVAYQMHTGQLADRLKSRLQLLHGQQSLRPVIPAVEDVELRPCADGRLLECLCNGSPALRTMPGDDGVQHAWPLRVAVIDNNCHVFR